MTSTGKNFSANNATGLRRKADAYETPYSITQQLLEVERFEGSILEPACGNGAVVVCLLGFITFYDIEKDFLTETIQYDNIITNPPYSICHQFILHAKKIARKKIALLLPLSYLHGKKRHDEIFTDKRFALSAVHIFTRYIKFGDELRNDGMYSANSMISFAWFVWEKGHVGAATIQWIDNQPYIVNKAS